MLSFQSKHKILHFFQPPETPFTYQIAQITGSRIYLGIPSLPNYPLNIPDNNTFLTYQSADETGLKKRYGSRYSSSNSAKRGRGQTTIMHNPTIIYHSKDIFQFVSLGRKKGVIPSYGVRKKDSRERQRDESID